VTTLYKNDAYSYLASAITTVGQTTITLLSGTGDRFPVVTGSDDAYITLETAAGVQEILKITARASGSDSLTVARAQEGTTAVTWLAGSLVEQRLTAGELAAFARTDIAQTFTDIQTINANSASPALLINQLGAGNALTIEDTTSPDSTPLIVDASGRLVVGHTAALATFNDSARTPNFQLIGTSTTTGGFGMAMFNNTTTTTATLRLARSRGTSVGSYTKVNGTTDLLGSVEFQGADGVDFIRGARIYAVSAGTASTGVVPTSLVFETQTTGGVDTVALTLNQAQAATFAGTVTVSTLTSGRLPLVSTAGLVTDSPTYTYTNTASLRNILISADGSTNVNFLAENTNSSGGAAILAARAGGAGGAGSAYVIVNALGTGDAYVLFQVSNVQDWTAGIDNSEVGDPYVISASSTLGTSNVLSITTAGAQTRAAVAFASLPAAASNAAAEIRVTDVGPSGYGSLWSSNGTVWKPINGQLKIYQQNTRTSVAGGGAETIVGQYLMPAGFLKTNDRLRLFMSSSKAGTTTTCVWKVYVGTAGTTADALITGMSGTIMAAANLAVGSITDIKVMSATSIQKMGVGNTGTAGYAATGNTAAAAATTISNVSNALYLTVTLTPGATDAVACEDMMLEYLSAL